MNCKFTKLTDAEIEACILPFIPKNKRGFSSKVNPVFIVRCIIHKLKTGCQWNALFIAGVEFEKICSWQLVYYYYNKWSKAGVFKELFDTLLLIQQDGLDTENLNLDGTQSLCKKSGESVGYQHRKKGRTSNVLVMTDGKGIPIAIGNIISGNHNDLYQVVPQLSKMIISLKQKGISIENSALNADKGFDSKHLIKYCHSKNIIPNIKENPRSRKQTKRGRKRVFFKHLYQRRFVNERTFAWLDSFRTLLIRFDTTNIAWLNWHYLAFSLILLKV